MLAAKEEHFPLLVVVLEDRAMMYPIDVYNKRRRRVRTPYTFSQEDAVDEFGRLTNVGRTLVRTQISARAKFSNAKWCVIWNSAFCTHFEPNGRAREGLPIPANDVTRVGC